MCGAQSTLYDYSLTALKNKNPFRDGIVLARSGPESWVVAPTSQASSGIMSAISHVQLLKCQFQGKHFRMKGW